MSNNVTISFVILVVNFLVLGCVHAVFEYFDTGDDPLYSYNIAFQHLIVSLFLAAAMVWQNNRKKSVADQEDS